MQDPRHENYALFTLTHHYYTLLAGGVERSLDHGCSGPNNGAEALANSCEMTELHN